MEHAAMNGLRTMVEAIAKGDTTLHSITPSPAREDFESDEAWEAAYDEWTRRVCFWSSESRPA
jgi:hypothetical protein